MVLMPALGPSVVLPDLVGARADLVVVGAQPRMRIFARGAAFADRLRLEELLMFRAVERLFGVASFFLDLADFTKRRCASL